MNESPIIGKYVCRFDRSSELGTDEGFFILEPGKGLEDALLFSTNEEGLEETESDAFEDLFNYSGGGHDFPKKFINALLNYKGVVFYNAETKFVLHVAKKAIISFEKMYYAENEYFFASAQDLLKKVIEKKKTKKRHNPEITEEDRNDN